MKIKIEWSGGEFDAETRSFVFDFDEARRGLALLSLKPLISYFRRLELFREDQFCPEASRTMAPEMIMLEAGNGHGD